MKVKERWLYQWKEQVGGWGKKRVRSEYYRSKLYICVKIA
jgi:hypothetical protein